MFKLFLHTKKDSGFCSIDKILLNILENIYFLFVFNAKEQMHIGLRNNECAWIVFE